MFSTSLARLWELWAGFFCLFWLIALTLKFKISRQSLLTAKGLKKSIGLFGRFFHAFMALQKATSKAVKTKGTEMQIYYVFSTFVIVWDLPLHPFYCRSSTMNCSLKGICHWPIDDDGHLVWFSLFLLLCGLFKEKYDFWASQNFAVNINCFFFFPEFLLFFPMMLWFLNSLLIRWYLWVIFIHSCLMPILFYWLAGSRCQGLSGGELRGWKRMINLQSVLAHLFAVSYSIKTNIYNSAPSCHSQP